MNPERGSSIQRVVGNAPLDYKEGVLAGKKDQFNNNKFEELEGKEKKKTPEQVLLIQDVDKATNAVLLKYGLPPFSIPPDNIHLIYDDAWTHEKGDALFSYSLQAIAVRETLTDTAFMAAVFHEMLHFKSYGALQADRDAERINLRDYRVGLSMVGRTREKGVFFTTLNEAVTEELTKRHARALLGHPNLREEAKETVRTIREYPYAKQRDGSSLYDEDTYAVTSHVKKEWCNALWRHIGTSIGLRSEETKIMAQGFAYPAERKVLSKLTSKIYQENKESFANQDEVFEVFAKAMMTGNILNLGKLVEKTFGEGTFRNIGEFDDDVESLRQFVDTL